MVAGPYLTGRTLHDVLDLDVVRSIASTRVFRMAEVRLLLVLLGIPLLLRLRRGLSPNAQLAGVLLGELTIGTVALAGHSGSGRWAGARRHPRRHPPGCDGASGWAAWPSSS